MNHHTSSFSSDLSVLILCEQELRWGRNHKRRKEEIRTCLLSGESGSDFLRLVRLTGLEPASLSAPDPKSGVSANSTTGAFFIAVIIIAK